MRMVLDVCGFESVMFEKPSVRSLTCTKSYKVLGRPLGFGLVWGFFVVVFCKPLSKYMERASVLIFVVTGT